MIEVINMKYCTDKSKLADISRPTILGNPWSHKRSKIAIQVATKEIAISKYKHYIYDKIRKQDSHVMGELKMLCEFYKSNGGMLLLGCHCKDKNGYGDCHGLIIKDILEYMLRNETIFKNNN